MLFYYCCLYSLEKMSLSYGGSLQVPFNPKGTQIHIDTWDYLETFILEGILFYLLSNEFCSPLSSPIIDIMISQHGRLYHPAPVSVYSFQFLSSFYLSFFPIILIIIIMRLLLLLILLVNYVYIPIVIGIRWVVLGYFGLLLQSN